MPMMAVILVFLNLYWIFYGIHFLEDEPGWGKCPTSSANAEPVIPCRPKTSSDSFCIPPRGELATKWMTEWTVDLKKGKVDPIIPDEGGDGDTDTPDKDGDTSSNTWIYIVIAVVVGLLLLALFFYFRHRRRVEEMSQPDYYAPEMGTAGHTTRRIARDFSRFNPPETELVERNVAPKPQATRDVSRQTIPVQVQHDQGNIQRLTEATAFSSGSRQLPPSNYERKRYQSANEANSLPHSSGGGPSGHSSVQSTELTDLYLDNTEVIDGSKVKILKVIGSGSFGEVFLARFSGAQVALKKMHAWKSEEFMKEFKKEIGIWKTLKHPNIVQFMGVTAFSDLGICIMSEYMEGGDLRTLLTNPQVELSWSHEKLELAKDIACGIIYLHSFDPPILHRDLKSPNVLIGRGMTAKLADFGLSKELETQTMSVAGSNLWMAPEVSMGRRYTEKSDIFSFGVVLSEIDTRKKPYANVVGEDGKPLLAVAIAHQVAVCGLRPVPSGECPEAIKHLIHVCTDKNPDLRPTADEIWQMLEVM